MSGWMNDDWITSWTMNGGVDSWMDRGMNEWMEKWIVGWMDE